MENNKIIKFKGITSLTIPNELTSMEDVNLAHAFNITSITIPASLTDISKFDFRQWELTSITADADNPNFSSKDGVLFNKDFTEILICPSGKEGDYAIPKGVTSISKRAFYMCRRLNYITIPDGVTSIGNNAFERCSSLTSINIPSSVTSIGKYAFEYCNILNSINVDTNNAYYSSRDGVLFNKEMTELIKYPEHKKGSYVVPDGITDIAIMAFGACETLSRIKIPDGVTKIGDWAFYCCTSLATVALPESVTSIGENIFIGCGMLKSITVDDNNQYYSSKDGVLYNKDFTEIISYPAGKSEKYIIPDSVTKINRSVFEDCLHLTSVKIPDGLTSICKCAFEDCIRLRKVIIPNSVTSIKKGAFSGCISLTSIDLPAGLKHIEKGTFEACERLTSIKLPDGVQSIGEYAFKNCVRLRKVIIPDSVTRIEKGAFTDCENLKKVIYLGTKAQWNKIAVGEYNDGLLNAKLHFRGKE